MEVIEELSATVARAEVIAGVEQAASLAASQTAGRTLSVRLDPESGSLRCFASKRVVEEVRDPETEVLLSASPEGSEPGEVVALPAPLGAARRSAARAGREVLASRLRGAKSMALAGRYRDRVGKLETGTVKRREGADLIVDLGLVEGRIPASEQSRHEVFNLEDTVRASVLAVEADEPPVVLSRIRPELLAGVIERETPEVRQGSVEVRATARRPGIRAKAAVWSDTVGVNPVAACLGPGGARIRAVSRELRGERVDVVLWSRSPERFARNALQPAEVLGVRPARPGEMPRRPAAEPGRPGARGGRGRRDSRDGGRPRAASPRGFGRGRTPHGSPDRSPDRSDFPPDGLVVTVSAEELPRALGKRGQNVRLASELIGIPIEVVAEGETPGARGGSRERGGFRSGDDRERRGGRRPRDGAGPGRGDRPARHDRSDRHDRPDRNERFARSDRPRRASRPDRPGRPPRGRAAPSGDPRGREPRRRPDGRPPRPPEPRTPETGPSPAPDDFEPEGDR